MALRPTPRRSARLCESTRAEPAWLCRFRGEPQLISTGNLAQTDRAALFFMDYPRQERLKLLGHARVLDAREHTQLADQLAPAPDLRGNVERLFLIGIIGFDWNCPKYITPRYTEAEVRAAVVPLQQRLADLEARGV